MLHMAGRKKEQYAHMVKCLFWNAQIAVVWHLFVSTDLVLKSAQRAISSLIVENGVRTVS